MVGKKAIIIIIMIIVNFTMLRCIHTHAQNTIMYRKLLYSTSKIILK